MSDSQDIPYGYCHCGCGGRTTISERTKERWGWVKGQPRLYRTGHNRRTPGPHFIVDDNGCWIWQKSMTPQGYGTIRGEGAHRVFYEDAKGPIPEGLHLDHLCRTPACVNPDHLEPVTNELNSWRGDKAKLTPEAARQIFRERDTPARVLGARYGVSLGAVYDVWYRRTWRSATDGLVHLGL